MHAYRCLAHAVTPNGIAGWAPLFLVVLNASGVSGSAGRGTYVDTVMPAAQYLIRLSLHAGGVRVGRGDVRGGRRCGLRGAAGVAGGAGLPCGGE